MEGVSVTMYHGLRRYWKRRTYRKLSGSVHRRPETAEFGSGGGSRRRRVWRVKMAPKLRLLRKLPSLKKLLLWLRDSYVKAMMAFANSRVIGSGGEAGGGGMGRSAVKEYDEKMIVEIYKSLMVAQGRLVAAGEGVRPGLINGRLPMVRE